MKYSNVGLALLMLACSGDSGRFLRVSVRTDFVPGVEFNEIAIETEGMISRYTPRAGDDFVRGIAIANFDEELPDELLLTATLFGPDGARVIRRSVAVLVTGQTTATIVLTRSCLNVECPSSGAPAANQCDNGVCVTPSCSPETPEACADSVCESASDCPALVEACGEVLCTSGECLFSPIVGSCGDTEACVPGRGCVSVMFSDAGADASTDAGTPDSGTDGGMDAGDDAGLPPSCDAPCDTGNVCEEGIFDCTSGVPVCSAVGAGNAGATCREAAGACDVAETCDGSSSDCPADGKQAAGTVCNPSAGPCDIQEVCDGDANACPLDAFEPVGTSCPGGFCDETNACSDTCSPGAACTPTNNCRTGTINCAGGVPSCQETGNVSNGTECQATEFGPYGSCGNYSGSCDETGTQARSVSEYACQSGTCTLASSMSSRSCMRDTDGGSCGSVTLGAWSSCGGFAGTCDTTGTRSRDVNTPTCGSGSCTTTTTVQTEACTRSTNGTSCGTVTYGGWGSCGGFAGTCDTTGTRGRDVYTPTCGGGSCGTVTTSQSESCTRSTNGLSCGTVTFGSWSACGGFTSTCDTTGTRSRDVNTPTCGSGSCSTVTTSQSEACARSTNGMTCGAPVCGAYGTCVTMDCTDGMESRTCTPRVCSSGSCGNGTPALDSRACIPMDGTSCSICGQSSCIPTPEISLCDAICIAGCCSDMF